MAFREPIVLNLMRNMITLVETAQSWSLVFMAANQPEVARLQGLQIGPGLEIDVESGESLGRLWLDPAALIVMSRANETSIDDAHPYFMAQLSRLADPDYVPSTDDILRCRVKTLGIHETHFHSPNALDFILVDVGGQRTERRKWIHCFDDVTLLIFVAALSEYDQVIEEDNVTNRLRESIDLFANIVNNAYFCNKNICIFYNKDDLFRAKVPLHEFAKFHPEYEGENSPEAVRSYIADRFESANKADSKQRVLYSHTTQATDTGQIKVVWSSIDDCLLRENLASAGFAQDL